jgi:hypothetical protein
MPNSTRLREEKKKPPKKNNNGSGGGKNKLEVSLAPNPDDEESTVYTKRLKRLLFSLSSIITS